MQPTQAANTDTIRNKNKRPHWLKTRFYNGWRSLFWVEPLSIDLIWFKDKKRRKDERNLSCAYCQQKMECIAWPYVIKFGACHWDEMFEDARSLRCRQGQGTMGRGEGEERESEWKSINVPTVQLSQFEGHTDEVMSTGHLAYRYLSSDVYRWPCLPVFWVAESGEERKCTPESLRPELTNARANDAPAPTNNITHIIIIIIIIVLACVSWTI